MSRITYHEDLNDVQDLLAFGRWEANARRVWTGKRGQQALRELEAALLALPEQRLVESTLCEPEVIGDGPVIVERLNVCVLGAYALGKGVSIERLTEISDEMDGWGDGAAHYAAESLGLTYTLAWQLMEANDEKFGDLSHEDRYEQMLALVRDHLAKARIQGRS